MLQLLLGQGAERLGQGFAGGIAKHQLQGRPSGFALAMGMIDQHLVRAVDRLLQPKAAAGGREPTNRSHRLAGGGRHSWLLRKWATIPSRAR